MTQDNLLAYTRFVTQELANKKAMEVQEQTGINVNYLYAIKRGDFVNIKKKHFDQLDSTMLKALEADTDAWKIGFTRNLSIANTLFKRAQTEKLCLALTGNTGFGKTEACKLYRRKNSDVVYVHCNTEMTKNGFLEAIAIDLCIQHSQRGVTSEARIKAIIRFLLKLETPLLVIDDAGKLRDSAFRMFQILFDEAAGRIGFVLTGVPEFQQKVFKYADRGVFCYKEIARRIGWVQLGYIYRQDIISICHKNGITDASAIDYLYDNIGDFDTLRRTIRAAQLVAKQKQQVINRTFLSDMNIDITNYRVSKVQ